MIGSVKRLKINREFQLNKSLFRSDINGLRAVAVIGVVLFHFSSNYLPGGFVGVDVFFVISGFLMTSIIFRAVDSGEFSLINFIKARCVRILPALLLTISLLLIFGFFFFGPAVYQAIGKHSLGSAIFISNFMYMFESGYFDPDSKRKFLLHTWSLSVEWQFYIIYPIAIALLRKFLSRNCVRNIIFVSAISIFVYCVFLTAESPVPAYFMIYSRAWEMMVGGLAFLFPLSLNEKQRKWCEVAGVASIILSMAIINESASWPGYLSIAPVAATYLCLVAHNKNSILSGYLLSKIGLISYSMYLMHWPVIVAFRSMGLDVGFLPYVAIVLSLSLLCYYTVEKKRNYGKGLFYSFLSVCIISYLVSLSGASFRIKNPDYKLTLEEYREKYEGHSGLPATEDEMYINGNKNDFDYILVGDSHARHIFAYILNSDIKVASWATDSCKSTKHFFSKISYSFKLEQRCKNRYEKVVSFINSNPGKKVIWMSAWRDGFIGKQRTAGDYKNNIIDEIHYFLDDISGSKSEVFIVGDTQGSKKVMYECLANGSSPMGSRFSGCERSAPYKRSAIDDDLSELSIKYGKFKFIRASDALCNNGWCEIIKDGMPVYTDTQHLTKKSARAVGEYIFRKTK